MAYIKTGKEKLFFFGARPSETDGTFFIDNVGITYPSADYCMERGTNSRARALGVFVFEYVVSGKGIIEQGGRTYHVGAGDFYFLNCNYDHKYYADKRDPYQKLWINAGGTLVQKMLEAYNINQPVVVKHIEVGSVFEDTIEMLKSCGLGGREDIGDKVALRVCELIIAMHAADRIPDNSIDTLARRIRRYIDSRVNYGVTLEDIERQFFINKSYIIHLFKKEYDITPKQYILQKKIEAAKLLLAGNSNQIKEVSSVLGFSSSQHFSSVFKRMTGSTPDEYRRSLTDK